LLLDLGIPEQVARDGLPRAVDRAGLDELCATLQGRAARARANERADLLVERACQQFRVFCREPDFLEVLEAVHQCNRRMVGERIPGIVDDRFADLPEELRARLQLDLRGIFLSYMHEVYGSIKEAAQSPHLEARPPELH
jgi:hypothetical protein